MSRSNKSLGWAVLGLSLLAICCAPGKGAGEDQAAAVGPSGTVTATPSDGSGSSHRKLALLVGVGAYKYARPLLYGPVNDVEEMKSVLTSPDYGFQEADVHVLVDPQATRDRILAELDQHLGKADGGDLVVFYFSGHGSSCANATDPNRDDNTIVPYDGRDPAGLVDDIRDKELNLRARQLSTAVGVDGGVTFILDSCHSGDGIKAAGTPRTLKREARCGPRRIPATTEKSGYGDESLRYVLIAGSRTDQTSFERTGADGKTRGALTENLVQELRRPSAKRRTYRDIMNRVTPAVQSEYANQIPQLEGQNRDQVIFGTDTIETRNYVLASAASGGQVRIEGGQLHGFTKGSQFDIYGPEAHTFEAPEQPLTRATLDSPEAISTLATISPVVPIPPGAKAVERQHNFEGKKTRILYEDLEGSVTLRKLAGILDRAADSPFERVAAGQPYQIRVVERNRFIYTFGADGRELSDGVRTTTPNLAALLEKRILDWTTWFGLIGLQNRTGESLAQIELIPRGVPPSPSSTPAFTRMKHAFDIRVKNLTDRKLFVYIMDLPSDGSRWLVYNNDGSNVPLEGQQEKLIEDWEVDLPTGVTYIRDVFKLIAASEQVDLSYLEAGRPRDAPPDPLNQLLLAAFKGVRHGSRSVAVGWGTAEVAFEVCEKLDSNGRCPPPPASDTH